MLGIKRPRRGVVVVALALLVLAGAGAFVSSRASGASSVQADRLREVERARLHALVVADTATARSLTADDFQAINPGGSPLSRDNYLAAVEAGDIDYLAYEPTSPIDVRLYGDAAALRYQVHFDLTIGGQLRLTHEGWITELYERRHGDWQIVWEQATGVPNDFDALVEALQAAP